MNLVQLEFLARGGGGAGLRDGACVGAKGVCKVSACVYNSSSDKEGEEDSGEDKGESNGLRFCWRSNFWSSVIGITPAGQSRDTMELSERGRYSSKANAYLESPTT